MSNGKPTISFVTLGHVDHGKSTTMGRFLHEIGEIDSRRLERMRKEAEEMGMLEQVWAFTLDSLPEEREKGLTSDIAFQSFETQKYVFAILDAPGHRDFVKNMIRGASQADACLLVISAEPGDLRAGLKLGDAHNPGGQTREHAIIGSVLGIQQIIVLVNKMDLVNYSEEAYNNAVEKIKTLFRQIGATWAKMDVPFIPISGKEGVNLTEPSSQMSWYEGKTLYAALDDLSPPDDRSNLPLRFIAQDTFDLPGSGAVLQGRVASGVLKTGQDILAHPGSHRGTVREILVEAQTVPVLKSGAFAVVSLNGIDRDTLFQPGLVLSATTDPPVDLRSLTIRTLVLDSSNPFSPGKTCVIHIGTADVACTITQIVNIVQEKSKYSRIPRKQEGNITLLFPGEVGELQVKPDFKLVAESYDRFPDLGRVIFRSMGQTIAVGQVLDINV
ncbi:MAG: GTP-binding protein [Promethearchaeota archaeon]